MQRAAWWLCSAVLAVLWCGAAPATDAGGHVEVTRARILQQAAIPVFGFHVLKAYPHDISSYTEGLVYLNGAMYEGAGLYGHSMVRKWDLATGKTLDEVTVDKRYFGEGVTVLGGKIFELTYLGNKGFIYDQASFKREAEFRYITQGWGLTNDGRQLVMSDGSSSIQFLDPRTLEVTRHIFVTDDVGPVGFLNELEYADGKLYANVWQTDFIAIIDPQTGKITGWIDLTGLNPDPKKLVYPLVLNGIAYDTATKHLLVTGKCWPQVYEIVLLPHVPITKR